LKQEVRRRLAAHKSRLGPSTATPVAAAPSWQNPSSLAAQAAARVAARYAQTPSYSQLQAIESVAVQTLPEPQPVAEFVAGQPVPDSFFESFAEPVPQPASLSSHSWEPQWPKAEVSSFAPLAWPSAWDWELTLAPAQTPLPASPEAWERQFSRPRWNPASAQSQPAATDIPLAVAAPAQPAPAQPTPAQEVVLSQPAYAAGLWDESEIGPEIDPAIEPEIVPVEPDLPLPANLIEFPRQLVASRRRRPRRAEEPFASQPFASPEVESQLSIFEVDPSDLPVLPIQAGTVWPQPEWSALDPDPQTASEPDSASTSPLRLTLELAPAGARLSALLVDGALVSLAFLGAVLVAAANIGHPPAARVLECSAAVAFLLIGLLYHAFFLILARSTPGMSYASLSFCTFDGQIPTRAQLRGRFGALLLSLLPVGLGLAWMLFDDEHLCWHDRLSRTYLRQG
jgi:uncharacterized RDD family membrane protein YckC